MQRFSQGSDEFTEANSRPVSGTSDGDFELWQQFDQSTDRAQGATASGRSAPGARAPLYTQAGRGAAPGSQEPSSSEGHRWSFDRPESRGTPLNSEAHMPRDLRSDNSGFMTAMGSHEPTASSEDEYIPSIRPVHRTGAPGSPNPLGPTAGTAPSAGTAPAFAATHPPGVTPWTTGARSAGSPMGRGPQATYAPPEPAAARTATYGAPQSAAYGAPQSAASKNPFYADEHPSQEAFLDPFNAQEDEQAEREEPANRGAAVAGLGAGAGAGAGAAAAPAASYGDRVDAAAPSTQPEQLQAEPATDHLEEQAPAPRKSGFLGKPLWLFLAATLALVVVLGVALGVGLGVGLSHNNNDSDKNLVQPSPAGGKAGRDNKPKTLPPWNWTDTKNKVYGVNLGGWLLLERWLYEDWFVQTGGPDAWDEWTMSQKLGDKMPGMLQKHFDEYFTEQDIDQLQSFGINTLRIPIGYWAFVPTQGDEPYKNATQLDHLATAMRWAQERSMYVIIDLHGLPGSQNGDQSSGRNMSHATTLPWFQDSYQKRSDDTLKAALSWLNSSDARSTVSGITAVNEPQSSNKKSRLGVIRDFYDRSFKACSQYKVPLIIHHGFVSSPDPYEYWHDFVSGKDPNMLIFDNHPYPGWFPPNDDQDKINQQVCKLGHQANGYPVPVIMGEWSGVSNVNTTDYKRYLIESQLSVYGWSAGSTYFSFKTAPSQNPIAGVRVGAEQEYSLFEMVKQGVFPKRDTSKSVVDFTDSLQNNCGKNPGITWKNPSS